MSRRVTDTSPLVFLGKLDRLDLLTFGGFEVVVPTSVLQEVRAKHDDASRRVEARLGAFIVESPRADPLLSGLLPDLGRGEADVIALALHREIASVALDDLNARRTARRVGLRPIGTVGLLLAGRKVGSVGSLAAELERLDELGFRLSVDLRDAALREAGEL